MERKARILFVDDFHLCRSFFALALREGALFEIFEAEPSGDICGIIDKIGPDLVILNISMMHCSGFSLLRMILRTHSNCRILTISYLHHGYLHAVRAIHAGALGYIAPDESRESFLEAIKVTSEGGVYLGPSLKKRIPLDARGRLHTESLPFGHLSGREFEVLCLTGHGYVPKIIADRMKVSVKTVETYRERIREKLGLIDGSELLHYATGFIREQSLPQIT